MTGWFESIGKYITHIGDSINALTQNSAIANMMIGAGAVLGAYFAPIVGLIVTCFVLTAIDMAYGIAVAKKLKKKITSEKNWGGTITKLWHELLLLGMARLVEFTVLGSESVFVLTGGITIIVSLTELWSIIENLNTLYPHGPWKLIGAFLKKKGEDYVGMDINLKDGDTDDTDVVEEPLEDRR